MMIVQLKGEKYKRGFFCCFSCIESAVFGIMQHGRLRFNGKKAAFYPCFSLLIRERRKFLIPVISLDWMVLAGNSSLLLLLLLSPLSFSPGRLIDFVGEE